MNSRNIRLLLVALIAIGINGCATSGLTIPENLGQSGLLVGDVSTKSVVYEAFTTPVINGKIYKGGLRDGRRLVVPLPPGEYTLESLFSSSGGGMASPSVSVTSTQTLPLGRKFTIEAGRVTNAGLIVLLPKKDEPKKYTIYLADNTSEIAGYLQAEFPKLYGSLSDRNIKLAPGRYLPKEQLPALRSEIAANSFSRKLDYEKLTARFATGDAGTLARIERDQQGRAQRIQLVDTGTLERLWDEGCGVTDDRAACIVGSKLSVWTAQGRVDRLLPAGFGSSRGMYIFKNMGVVIVDDHLNFYTSLDNAVTWKKYLGVARDDSIESTLAVHFSAGTSGFYARLPDKVILLFANYTNGDFRKLEIPKSVDFMAQVTEVTSGVIIGPELTFMQDARLAFGNFNNSSWEVRKIPAKSCMGLIADDPSGRRLRVQCSTKFLRSEDAGRTWHDMP
jgi:hypothetical protein